MIKNTINNTIKQLTNIKDYYQDKKELNELIKINNLSKITTFNKNLLQDLEFFEPIQKETENSKTIFSVINNTKSNLGKHYLRNILESPTYSIKTLKKRQKLIKEFKKILKKTKLQEELHKLLENENEYIWLKQPSDYWTHIHNNLFFQYKLLDPINTNELGMLGYNFYKIIISPISTIITPFYSILLPVIYLKMSGAKIPYLQLIKFAYKLIIQNLGFNILKSKSAWGILGSILLWLGLYLLNVYSSITGAQERYKNLKILSDKIQYIQELAINTNKIIKILETNKYLKNKYLTDEMYQTNNELIKIFDKRLPTYSLLSNKGIICSHYHKLVEYKTQINISAHLNFLAELDYYTSITDLLNTNYSFAKYITKNKTPLIKIKNCRHPCLENPTENSIFTHKNILITGPNAAGKSTFIKTLMINIYLAQTLGICPSEVCELTLFNNYCCHLFLTDSKGSKSLFQTEVDRCLTYLKYLEKNKLNKSINNKTLLIMDEIFSSTNYIEGMAAAFAFCETIYHYENNLSFITTHHSYLNKLQQDYESKVENKMFEAKINTDKINTEIIFPYKIKNGFSKQHLALQLISQSNPNKDFIAKALSKANKIETKFT